ncbi:hypothetical protein DMB68_16680 [Flavobacterium hydrophilum]|uniref:Flavodoxin-like domain-containing protein n=1 Tax=Flavobacterium hydrophilum TaxID=2211445 RepID=A0A2V4CDC6_9FLAO|nr:hypothetical protein DMB68_16680 [Flavobacterium hydrophilum]
MCFLKQNKTLIVFSSKGNSAKNSAFRILDNLNKETEILCLNDNFTLAQNLEFKNLILVCPTYGDEEMERRMEDFLVKSDWNNHQKKNFAICELGLYRGYLETEQGAGIIIKKYLLNKNLFFLGNLLSVDSIPLDDFSLIDKWSQEISSIL